MTSTETDVTDEITESPPITLEGINIDDKFDQVSCPFTWGLITGTTTTRRQHDIKLKRREDRLETVIDRKEYFPELELIYYLMSVFEDATFDDLPSAIEYMNKAEKSLADIKQKETMRDVENVLDHIVIGTKCHMLKLQECLTEANGLLNGIYKISDMNETELAMLSGCKSSACTLYAVDSKLGIMCALKAIEHEPNNGKWHFLLGQNYRGLRRMHCTTGKPKKEEATAFKKAFELSKNSLFGVSLAQMYRESGNYAMAEKIYKEVYELQPTCCTVRLILALGFIRSHETKLAKECLDYVAEKMPESSRLMHYMAIYEEKCNGNMKAALPYYKGTTDGFNWTAEPQYMNCLRQVETNWDPLPHMLNLLTKYEGYDCFIIAETNIQIASHYIFNLKDIPSGCKHLLEALQIDPDTNKLKDDYVPSREAKLILRKIAAMEDDEQIPILKDTLELCRKCCGYVPGKSASLSGQTHKPQSRKRWQKRGRNFATRPKTGTGTVDSSSSSQGPPKTDP